MSAGARYFQGLADLSRAGTSFVLATVIDAGGSTPRRKGAQIAVTAEAFLGTIGGGAFEHRILSTARALLADRSRDVELLELHLVRDLAMCCGGAMTVFLQKIEARGRLWVFGAGHVGTALARVSAPLGFEVIVVDGRAEWADPARFPPQTRVIDADPVDQVRGDPPGPDDLVVVLTHDHALDEALVRALAGHELRYLGLIGSRGKWARFRKRLAERGLPIERIDRVRCPVGVDIGAETPEEIAVSIAAELIGCRRASGH